MPKERDNRIICEDCDEAYAVIIHQKVYYCGECYMFHEGISTKDALMNLNVEQAVPKLKN